MKINMSTSSTVCTVFGLLCVLLLSSCTLRLEDKNAPSLGIDLETEYELASWGREKVGFAPTQPEIKSAASVPQGSGFRIRGKFSNTFTWTDPEGSLGYDFSIGDSHFKSNEPVEADGWSYRGRLSLMPGFSLAGDRLFLAGLIGLDGRYLELNFAEKENSTITGLGHFGSFGIPLGFYVECTIARTVTPWFCYAYIPNVSTWSLSLPGHDNTYQLGLRVWPGSVIPALGPYLWIEGGWLWTESEGVGSIPVFRYEIDISGPFLALGMRL